MSRNYKFHNQESLPFVTFTVIRWIDVFTRREYKDILVESLKFCMEKKGLELYAWVIMSNHVHLIIGAKNNPNNETYQFWQQDESHPIELWSSEVMDQKLEYIHNNPVVAGWVDEPEHHLYSSVPRLRRR